MAIHYSILYIGVISVAYALLSKRLAASPITGPMYFTAAGLLGAWAGAWDPILSSIEVKVLLELTLGLVLFTEAMKLRLKSWNEDFELATRLLAIGMPLTIALGAILAAVVFTGVGLIEGALVATVLAPTDAALGLAVVQNPKVPERIREALAVESGLNDGIALPVLLFFLAILEAEGGAQFGRLFLEGVGIALAVGVVFGLLAGLSMREAARRDLMQPRWQQLTVVTVALVSLVVADELGGSGFIAAFVAGLVFGRVISGLGESVPDFADDLGVGLTMFAFALFGGVILFDNLEWFSTSALVYAALSLTVIRMVPVAISMIGARLRRPTVGFMGWFGPRGLASIIFAGVVVEESGLEHADVVIGAMAVTVTGSIFLHGASAYFGAEAYGNWAEERATPSTS